jgi:hypothetical protein
MILTKEQQELTHLITKGQAVMKTMEASFLKSSSFLEKVVDSSSVMQEDSRGIIRMVTWADGKEGNFDGIFHDLTRDLKVTSSLADRLHHNTNRVFEVGESISQFIEWEAELMQTLEPLNTMKTFFLIAVSKLSSNSQRAIKSVVEDIQRLYAEAKEVTMKELRTMNRLADQLNQHRLDIEQEMGQLSARIRLENQRLNDSLNALFKDLEKNRKVDVQLQQVTERIAQLVAEAVTVIQQEDITGQKLQHVFESLKEIHIKMAAWERKSCDPSESELARYLVSAARIQQAQLRTIMDEYGHSSHAIRSLCPNMIGEIERLDQECLALQEFNTLTTSADGAVQILLEAIDTVSQLIRSLHTLLTATEALLNPLKDVSAEMADVIESVTKDLRVVTVNARIMASRQGSQSGLTPLTENVGQISMSSQKHSARLREQLHAFVGRVADSANSFVELEAELSRFKQNFDLFRDRSNSELHAFRDRALQLLVNLSNHAEEVQTAIHDCGGRHEDSFDDAYFAQVDTLMKNIETKVLEHCAGKVDFSNLQVFGIDQLHERYTMHSERENHAKAIGGKTNPKATAPKEDDFILF